MVFEHAVGLLWTATAAADIRAGGFDVGFVQNIKHLCISLHCKAVPSEPDEAPQHYDTSRTNRTRRS